MSESSAASIVISRVRPAATEEELAAIMLALPAMWPAPQPSRRLVDDSAWRFSGRWRR